MKTALKHHQNRSPAPAFGRERPPGVPKFANELSNSETPGKRRAWTASRRAAQALRCRKTRPWIYSTGPKTAAGKKVSANNAYVHGLRGRDHRRLLAVLRASRAYCRRVRENCAVLRAWIGYKRDMKLQTLVQSIRDDLRAAGVETPALDADIIIRELAGLDRAAMIAHPETEIPADAVAAVRAACVRRAGGEPVSRILGRREFWGMDFMLTPDTLDPRPDTETLVEAALAWARNRSFPVIPAQAGTRPSEELRILDLGTGSGCILVALLKELPHARGVGVDLNPGAVAAARVNADANGVGARAEFLCGDWFAPLDAGARFDLIVSNPPYIAASAIESLQKEVRTHDPILALDGGADGLEAYKIILTKIKNRLAPGGRAFLEIGFGQLADVARLVDDSNATLNRVSPDAAGVPRVVEISHGEN